MSRERTAPSLPAVMVRLNSTPPRGGGYQMMMRIRRDDKACIDLAAKALCLSQADFLRSCAVNGAREVLKQLGIPEPVYVPTAAEKAEDDEFAGEPIV